jgi:ethanolamine utilization protein EutA
MMTEDLDFSISVDEYSFSGGVAELIYGSAKTFDDIGVLLAEEIKKLMKEHNLSIIEPKFKIRATVIGAGAFTLSVSGSTCYFDDTIEFPIENIPVVPVNLTLENFSQKRIVEEVNRALVKYDIQEGDDLVALYFKDPNVHSTSWLNLFAMAIEEAFPQSIAKQKMVILLFGTDIGKMVGLQIRRETNIQHNLICLDELELEAGDWIDIGAPLHSDTAFPLTVKSLVFNQSKEYSG